MKRKLLTLTAALLVFMTGTALGQSNALEFDGTACVDISEITELTGTGARSVDAWVKIPEVHDYSEGVLIEWGENSSGKKWTIRMDNDRLRVEHGSGNVVGSTNLNDDTWHHVAVTFPGDGDLTTVKLYVDGFEESYTNKTGGAVETGSGSVAIGRSVTDDVSARYWLGGIDEVRLWKKELTVFELIEFLGSEVCATNEPDLVAYYRFNEGAGTTTRDETGKYPGVFGNGINETGAPEWIDGVTIKSSNCSPVVEGMALNFAKNSCVDIPEITALTGTAARTVEAWIKVPTDNLDWWQPVVIEWGQNTAGGKWDIRLDYFKLRVEHGQGYATASTLLNDGQWHHIAVSVGAEANITDVSFYIDGYLDPISASAENNVMINTASGAISIGRAISDDQEVRNWVGDIDEVRLWTVERTANQILGYMDSELCPEYNPDLIAYYKMNEGSGTTVSDETGNYNGVLGTGKVDDGLPTWTDGVSLYEGACSGTGIFDERVSAEKWLVYPNPANDYIYLPEGELPARIEIVDLTGRVVFALDEPGSGPLDISSIQAGVHILLAYTKEAKVKATVKLIKFQ